MPVPAQTMPADSAQTYARKKNYYTRDVRTQKSIFAPKPPSPKTATLVLPSQARVRACETGFFVRPPKKIPPPFSALPLPPSLLPSPPSKKTQKNKHREHVGTWVSCPLALPLTNSACGCGCGCVTDPEKPKPKPILFNQGFNMIKRKRKSKSKSNRKEDHYPPI